MFKNRIKLLKDGEVIYTQCPFCDGFIPVEFEPLHNENQIRIKGRCKKCHSYIQVRTQRYNFITDWLA